LGLHLATGFAFAFGVTGVRLRGVEAAGRRRTRALGDNSKVLEDLDEHGEPAIGTIKGSG